MLLIGGAISLILPLLGVAYLKLRDSGAAKGPQRGSGVFERRDSGQVKITPSATAAPEAAMPMPSGSVAPKASQDYGGMAPPSSPAPGARGPQAAMASSLDFIKSADMGAKKEEASAVSAQTAPTPAAAAPAPAPAEPAKTVAKTKTGKKTFAMPKLNPSRGFSNNFGKKSGGGGGGSGDAPPDIPPDMLKNLPGADNPDVQKILQQQGR